MKFKPFPELTNILLPEHCETSGEISAKPLTLLNLKFCGMNLNGGMAKYSTTQNALLYETKASQKWNGNEMRKLF